MDLWQLWLDAIRQMLQLLTADAGLGLGLAIIALTWLLKTAILPLSWSAAYRAAIRQKKLAQLAPELERLKTAHGRDHEARAAALLGLYRKHGLTPVDGRSVLGALVQLPALLGMFQVLRDAGAGAKFLWVASLAKPDAWLAVLAAVTTALMMLANPDLPEQMRVFLILLPSIIAAIVALQFCSALAVYWTASNLFSAAQTLALHLVIGRRVRSGAVRI